MLENTRMLVLFVFVPIIGVLALFHAFALRFRVTVLRWKAGCAAFDAYRIRSTSVATTGHHTWKKIFLYKFRKLSKKLIPKRHFLI